MVTTVKSQSLVSINKNPSFVGEDIQQLRLPDIFKDDRLVHKIPLDIEPNVVQFEKFTPGQKYIRGIRVRNATCRVLRIYVTNPMTKWFIVVINKEHNLLPGLNLKITVKFKPDEDRYYCDYFTISSQISEAVVIPIHAFPVVPLVHFPTHIQFPQITVGESTSKVITVTCTSPLDLKFCLKLDPSLEEMIVLPIKGVLPSSGEPVVITIKYSPQIVVFLQQNLILNVTNLDISPGICKITNFEIPNKVKMLKNSPQNKTEQKTFSLDIHHRKKKKFLLDSKNLKHENFNVSSNWFSYEFPSWPESRGQSGKTTRKPEDENSRQMKEEDFLEELKQFQIAAKLSQTRWQRKIGCLPVTNQQKRFILAERDISLHMYRKREELDSLVPLTRLKTEILKKRPMQNAATGGPSDFHFNFDEVIDNWPARILALNRFIHAVYKVMFRYRVEKRLRVFRTLRSKRSKSANEIEKPTKKEFFVLKLNSNKLKPNSTALFSQLQKQNLLSSELHYFPVDTFNCEVNIKPQSMDIQKPLLHEVLGYKPFDVYEAGTNYIPVAPRPPSEPKCIIEQFLACSTETKTEGIYLSSLAAPPEKLFEAPEVDSLIMFNPFPQVPRILSVPFATELDTVYPLYPLNTVRPADQRNSTMPVDELVDRMMEWRDYSFSSQAYFDHNDLTQHERKFPSVMHSASESILSIQVPPLEEEISGESKKFIDLGNLSPLDPLLVTRIPTQMSLKEFGWKSPDPRKGDHAPILDPIFEERE